MLILFFWKINVVTMLMWIFMKTEVVFPILNVSPSPLTLTLLSLSYSLSTAPASSPQFHSLAFTVTPTLSSGAITSRRQVLRTLLYSTFCVWVFIATLCWSFIYFMLKMKMLKWTEYMKSYSWIAYWLGFWIQHKAMFNWVLSDYSVKLS